MGLGTSEKQGKYLKHAVIVAIAAAHDATTVYSDDVDIALYG